MLKDLEYLTNQYFTFDEPVPFKGELKVYPVKVKDYYTFFSVVDLLMLDKNSNPETIPMSYLKFLQFLSQGEEGHIYNIKFNKLLELMLHINNGFFCPQCGYETTEEHIIQELSLIGNDMEAKSKKFHELKYCPNCQQYMYDIIRYVEEERGRISLYIKGQKLTSGDFDRFRDIVLYQNITDYEDESAMDTDLAAELKLVKQLKNKDITEPSLEKKLACAVISTGYTFEEIYNITIRKLNLLLRTEDGKMFYQAAKIGSMSGMVTFKTEPDHWIYERKKTIFDEGATQLDSLRSKLSNVAK